MGKAIVERPHGGFVSVFAWETVEKMDGYVNATKVQAFF